VLGGLLRQAYWTGGASGVAHLATAGSSAIWALPGLLMKSPVLLAVLVVGLLIAWLLARATDARIDRACSEFWHERQSLLLKPLMLQTDAARDGQSLASASGSAPM
jgi:hypothetical protein